MARERPIIFSMLCFADSCSARVIDILARNKRKHAYYYLGTGKVQTSEGIILSLIAQLCQGQQVLPKDVREVLLLRKNVRRAEKENSMKGMQ